MDFISVKEASEKWNISERRIQKLCEEKRIVGVARFGRMWIIPENANKPEDKRYVTSKITLESVMDQYGSYVYQLAMKLSGKAERLEQANIHSALQSLIAEQNIRKVAVWNTPRLNQLQITNSLSSLGVELISPNSDKHTIAQCDLGITEADYLLPETGTLVLLSSAEKPRAVSLAPRVHLAIVNPSMLRADMPQVFAEAKDSNYLVFITGPSRTADIELTVTLGVHGPKNLYVWMLS